MSVDTSDTVLVPSTNGGGSARRYHTTDCRYVTKVGENFREWEREMATAWDLEECRYCRQQRGESDE